MASPKHPYVILQYGNMKIGKKQICSIKSSLEIQRGSILFGAPRSYQLLMIEL